MGTQWTAQFLVASELERHGYIVTFTLGHNTSFADLMVGHPISGEQFWVDVKGLARTTAWFGIPKAVRKNLFYALVLVGSSRERDRFFILKQTEWNGLIAEYRRKHPNQKSVGGFNWTDPHRFEDRWEKFPNWQKQ